MIALSDRAFVVSFAELKRWSVNSIFEAQWHWPPQDIHPLSDALKRKLLPVDRKRHDFAALQLVTLHFDGEMEPRNLNGTDDFKGSLFFAEAGDVLYSKIDVRNGAIGIVPDSMPRVAVSSEYPVYAVNTETAVPQYIQLLFHTPQFRRVINSLISGASGRKRVQPEVLETIDVPLPPLSVQRAIVDYWHRAQREAAGIREHLIKSERVLQSSFYDALGITPPDTAKRPRYCAVQWKDLARWSGGATFLLTQVASLDHGRFPVVSGRDCLAEVRHGCSASPSPSPTALDVLKISAVTRGHFRPSERKYMYDKPEYRAQFDLRPGDVLMCRTNGTLAYVGMASLISDEDNTESLIFPDKVMRVRAKSNVLPAYLWHVLKSRPVRAQIEAAARTAIGNYAIGTEDIWGLRIPLPPLDAQWEIVGRVQEGRAEIARETARADALLSGVKSGVEAMILGTLPPPAPDLG